MTKVLITVDRPEDYDDVCAELVAEDFLATKGEGWSYQAEDDNKQSHRKLLKEMANRLNNCLVLLEAYSGSNADMKMIDKAIVTLNKYRGQDNK